MTNGLRPLAELCMDGCYADNPVVGLSAVNVRNAVYSAALNEAGTRNSHAISETSALTQRRNGFFWRENRQIHRE